MKEGEMFPTLKIGNRLVLKKPVIQGGMGVGVSLDGLAAGVANCGGGGTIAAAGIGFNEKDFGRNYVKANNRALEEYFQKARQNFKAENGGAIGVNVMHALTNYPDLMETAIKIGADYIISGAGAPFDMPRFLTPDSKTNLIPIIKSAKGAKTYCKRWSRTYSRLPDAFVVEGPMAGGHLGYDLSEIDDPNCSLEAIIPQVVEAVREFETLERKIPIIAAGGVYTGADIYKFLKLGASGVQMATRFVATHECDASIEFKMAYVNASEDDICIIESPVKMLGRAIINDFLRASNKGLRKPVACPYHCIKSCDMISSPYCIIRALINAQRGKLDGGFVFAGKNAYRIRQIILVEEVFISLEEEFDEAYENDPNPDKEDLFKR